LAGSPLGCVAALKLIDQIERQNLLERARTIGESIHAQLAFDSIHIGNVRGLGAMIGIEFVKDQVTK
jgi:4-aminobutyrate aminotransferase/(S)-3-amino-2-methylpropionate transaminase